MKRLRVAYYADDFTGATDALEALTSAGLMSLLFTSPPTPDQLADQYPNLEALGVASVARSMGVDELEDDVRSGVEKLQRLDPSILHYKVCSTFDSSPEIGNIGRATEIGVEITGSPFVPVVAGAPALGRYVLFGNLFASDGSTVHRLDRHPTMRNHPVTPMSESDLRLHLEAQTDAPIGLLDAIAVGAGPAVTRLRLQQLVDQGAKLVVMDTLTADDLEAIGSLIWGSTSDDGSLFVVGSSGVEHALTSHWRTVGEAPSDKGSVPPPLPVDQIIVLSASAALTTADQIEWARDAGWVAIPIDCGLLIDDVSVRAETRKLIHQTRDAYLSGQNVVLFSALGPHDPNLDATRARGKELGYEQAALGNEIGHRLGQLLTRLVHEVGPARVCVAGGDTSGHIVTELGVTVLEMIATTVPGAPLCRASSSDPAVQGLELVLKGGQTGPPEFFEIVRTGVRS